MGFGKIFKTTEKPKLVLPKREDILKEMSDLSDFDLYALAYFRKKNPKGVISFATGLGYAHESVKKDFDVSEFTK